MTPVNPMQLVVRPQNVEHVRPEVSVDTSDSTAPLHPATLKCVFVNVHSPFLEVRWREGKGLRPRKPRPQPLQQATSQTAAQLGGEVMNFSIMR